MLCHYTPLDPMLSKSSVTITEDLIDKYEWSKDEKKILTIALAVPTSSLQKMRKTEFQRYAELFRCWKIIKQLAKHWRADVSEFCPSLYTEQEPSW